MADLTYTNPTLSTTFTSTEVDSNFGDVQNAINGNLDNSNIKAGASIDVDKLSGQYERMTVQFKVLNNAGTTVTVNGIAGADLPTCFAPNDILDIVPIPGDSSDTNWTIADMSWVCNDTGDSATKVRIEWGYYDAVGAWTISTTPVAAWTLTNANANEDANDGHQVNGGSTELDFNHATGGNTPRSLALVHDTDGVGTLSAAGSFLVVSLTLKRKIQAS